ncbi:MAG: ABC transporter permease [Promethearchaeota archaeon]
MSDIDQEIHEKSEKNYNIQNKKLSSKIIDSFKFLFFAKYRLYQFQVKNEEKNQRKKRSKLKRMLKSSFTFFGVFVIFIIISLAVFGPWIAPYTYAEATGWNPNDWAPPSPEFLLGTASAGRDVLSRIIYGTKTALIIVLSSVSISLIIGIFLGMIAGYYGKWADSIIMRAMDIILAFPGLIFALAFLAIIGSTIEHVVVIFGLIGIPYYSRLIRSSVLKAKELDYIAAAKVSGANNWRIMFKHLLPNSIQPIIISMSFDIGRLILSLATLAFLGFTDPRYVDWGRDIFLGRRHIYEAPWASFWPSVMISICVIGFMIVGDGLRDAFDPRFQLVTR